MNKPIVLLTGGTGLIGKALSAYLQDEGYLVRNLSRREYNPISTIDQTYLWDPQNQEMDLSALEGVKYIIHMAGAGISSKRWSTAYKSKIRNSRIDGTRLIADSMLKVNPPLRHFISFSGVAIYGDGAEDFMEESRTVTDDPSDFLASVCKEWEAAAQKVKASILRLPPVLSAEGGSVTEMVKNNSRGTIAILGSGKQYFPWIHIEDLVRLIGLLLKSEEAPSLLNTCSPAPVTNKELSIALKKHFHLRGPYVTVPYLVLKLAIGGMAYELCKSSRVISSRLQDLGFEFKYPDIDSALQDIADN